jgi:hypothetical protein
MIKTIWYGAVILTCGLAGCRIVEDEGGGGSVTVRSFRIGNEIQGWSEASAEGYMELDPSTLRTSLVNGGADIYNNNGMVEAMQQVLESADGNRLTACIMDFASAHNATDMYDIKYAEEVAAPLGITGYPDDRAIAKSLLGGAWIFAHFDRFYIEIELQGYTQQGDALDAARLFLEYYEQIAD